MCVGACCGGDALPPLCCCLDFLSLAEIAFWVDDGVSCRQLGLRRGSIPEGPRGEHAPPNHERREREDCPCRGLARCRLGDSKIGDAVQDGEQLASARGLVADHVLPGARFLQGRRGVFLCVCVNCELGGATLGVAFRQARDFAGGLIGFDVEGVCDQRLHSVQARQ